MYQMNFAIDMQHFSLNNILLLEPTTNIVMSGSFTKINYITEWFTMNGIYIMFPIDVIDVYGAGTKMQMKYNPYTSVNSAILHDIAKMEHKLLDMYMHTHLRSVKKQISLSRQLQTGNMKIYKEMIAGVIAPPPEGFRRKMYMIKISGIWDSNDECGITYKLFEAHGYSS